MKKPAKKNTIIYQNAYAPGYDPSDRAEDDDVQYNNNCCNYACDIKGTYAQPGLAAGVIYKKINRYETGRKVAVAGGLTPIKYNSKCPPECHKAALNSGFTLLFDFSRIKTHKLKLYS